jgi:hypothetical protein
MLASTVRRDVVYVLYGRGGAHLLVGDLEDPMCDQALTSPRYSWLIWENARRRQEAVKVESHVPATNRDRFLEDYVGIRSCRAGGYKHRCSTVTLLSLLYLARGHAQTSSTSIPSFARPH